MESKNPKTIWMLVFESKPLVKIGGLGEVPPNISRELVELGYNVYIVIPSHGLLSKNKVREVGEVESTRIGLHRWGKVDFIVVGGGVLEDEEVYGPRLVDKVVAYARSIKSILGRISELGVKEPDIIHAHDWHSVLALLAIKTYYEENKVLDKKYVYQIHLTSNFTYSKELVENAGISLDTVHRVLLPEGHAEITVEEALKRSNGLADKLGALESDRLVTVSYAYLNDEVKGVKGVVGEELLFKARVVYNGTDWRYNRILANILKNHGERIREFTGKDKPSRSDMRRYLLLKAVGELGGNEPIIPDPRAREYITSIVKPPFKKNLKVDPFYEDGVLVLNTGRIATQKGVDILVEAIKIAVRRNGYLRFLLFELPVWSQREYIDELVEVAHNYPDNVRVVFGYAPSIYQFAHIVADIYVAPSRWEPFGITALEAMATGNPVVASRVGGFTETILDIREHGVKGTGILVEPEDPYELASYINDLARMALAYEHPNPWIHINRIEDYKLRRIVELNPRAFKRIRGSCIRRVESMFTWRNSAQQLNSVYRELF